MRTPQQRKVPASAGDVKGADLLHTVPGEEPKASVARPGLTAAAAR